MKRKSMKNRKYMKINNVSEEARKKKMKIY